MKVAGFKGAAIEASLRYKGRPDLGLIAADEPVSAAGVFTRNIVRAAPVLWSGEKIRAGRARAILVNAGQANACTGKAGLADADASAQEMARLLGCGANEILLASTGVIGEAINMPALLRAAPALVDGLREDGLGPVSRAMLTTDTRPKTVEQTGLINGTPFTMAGMTKGSGMIAPNMATMLGFILTDAAVDPAYLQDALFRAVEITFNSITVDGDTSTNDTVFLLAGGRAGNAPLTGPASPGAPEFERVLAKVCGELSLMIVADGEGATKLVHVRVRGAKNDEQAKRAAATVAESPLVKTALFGEDANWGRIMMALGRSGTDFDQLKVFVRFDDVLVVAAGLAAGGEELSTAVMKQPEFSINIDLGAGEGRADVTTCDLSYDYVKINADYRS